MDLAGLEPATPPCRGNFLLTNIKDPLFLMLLGTLDIRDKKSKAIHPLIDF